MHHDLGSAALFLNSPNKSNIAKEAELKAEQPINSQSVPKPVSCLKQQQEREGEGRQLQRVQTQSREKERK